MKLETVEAACVVLNCCKANLYDKIRKKKIPAYHIGRKVLVNIDEVLSALRNGHGTNDAK